MIWCCGWMNAPFICLHKDLQYTYGVYWEIRVGKRRAMSRHRQWKIHGNNRIRGAEAVPGNLTPRYLINTLSSLSEIRELIWCDWSIPLFRNHFLKLACIVARDLKDTTKISLLQVQQWYLVGWHNIVISYCISDGNLMLLMQRPIVRRTAICQWVSNKFGCSRRGHWVWHWAQHWNFF